MGWVRILGVYSVEIDEDTLTSSSTRVYCLPDTMLGNMFRLRRLILLNV
jgi:hypothetical protein